MDTRYERLKEIEETAKLVHLQAESNLLATLASLVAQLAAEIREANPEE